MNESADERKLIGCGCVAVGAVLLARSEGPVSLAAGGLLLYVGLLILHR